MKLILDGQQRITTLFGSIEGEPPSFFEGNVDSFTNLYFNVEEESFEFYRPIIMRGNIAWINVTEVMQNGASSIISAQFEALDRAVTHLIH